MKVSKRLQIIAGALLILLGLGLYTPPGQVLAHATETWLGLTDTPGAFVASRPSVVNAAGTALVFPANVIVADDYVQARYLQTIRPADSAAVHYRFYHTGAPSSGDKVIYDFGIYGDNEDAFFRGYDGEYKNFFVTDWDTGRMTFEAGDVYIPNGTILAQGMQSTSTFHADGNITTDGSAIATGDVTAGNSLYAPLATIETMSVGTVYGGNFVGNNVSASGDIYTVNEGADIYTEQGDINSGDNLTCDDNLEVGEYAAASNDPQNSHGPAVAQASGQFSAAGDAQYERYVLYGADTLNDTDWHQTTNHVHIPADTLWTYRVTISMATDGMAETGSYEIVGFVTSGNSAQSTTVIYEDDASWDVLVTAPHFSVSFKDTDAGGDAVRVVATIELTSVTY